MQLEHTVHESSDLLNSDSLDDRADESPERAILRHSRHQSPATGHTGTGLTGNTGTGHTGHTGTGHTGTGSTGSTGHTGQLRSNGEHSVRRSHSVRSDAVDHRSTLLNLMLQEHRLELEYGSASDRTRHRSRSSRKDSGTHRAAISLRHADPGELSPASMLRHRRVRSRSRSYDSVSLRRHSRSPSRSRGKKKKSHKKRRHSSTSSSSRRSSSSSSSRERTKHRHKSKKKKHTSSRSFKRDKRVKKQKRKRSPSPSSTSSSVSSYSSSSQQRSPARKRSRSHSRSPSSAEESSHVPAPRVESPALPRDHLSLYADDDDQFNSHSEDHQDLAPDAEIHSNVSDIHSNMSSDDMKFQNLIEEVFKLLPADRFPRKTEQVLGGNKPRSSIEMELMKAPKKSISLPQSKCPLSKTIDCIKQSLHAVETDGSYPMPSTIAQDWLPSKADINKLVKLKYYQAHEEFIPTTSASALDPDANRLDLSLSGSYPVKVSSLQALEGQARDMIRILSHAEIFSFGVFKCLQSENMDSKVLLEILKSTSMAVTDAMSLATVQTLGLQQMRREAAIDSAPKGSLTSEAMRKLRLSPFTSKLLFDGQIGAIYKENVAENHEILVKKAVSNQAKPNPSSSSSRKPKAKSGKNKTKPQETPKKDFPFPSPRPPRRKPSFRGSSPEVEVLAPPVEEPPPLGNTENQSPLPLPLPSIPVGGKLAHFAQNWAEITDNEWVLSLIRKGYRISVQRTSNSVTRPNLLSQQLEEEVASLLSKGAVEEIIPECPGYYSRIFLVPKKNGKLRLIIDLSVLNHFVYTETFKMEIQRKVRNAIQLNDWAYSLDLTDAYLHIPIHYRSRKYLRFTLRGRVYQFKALPFGLSTSPFVFTRLMIVIATFLRRRAITLHPYLDDWLALNQNRRKLLEHRQFILSLINSLGLIINYEKSDLVPA